MDHQVEHHIDIERTRPEEAQAVHFEEHRLSDERDGGAHRRVEALEMSDLGNAAMLSGEIDDLVGFFQGCGERLLNQHIETSFDRLTRYRAMELRRHRDGNRVCAAVRHKFANGVIRAGMAIAGDLRSTGGIAIDYADEFYSRHFLRQRPGLGFPVQFGVHAGMVLAEGARADHRDANGFGQF